uniref:Uncharacterized protein n=1 Tax=Tetraselmis sp. GSL018 TaxID=582737 RepID=A0A061S675_9CHLO
MSLVEDKDDRAEDLVLRLSDLRFEDCTRKNDLLGMETSGKFRTLCLRLAEATEAAVKAAGTGAPAYTWMSF